VEIYNINKRLGFKQFIRKFKFNAFIRILIVIIAVALFAFGNILYGAYLNKTAQTPLIKMFVLRFGNVAIGH